MLIHSSTTMLFTGKNSAAYLSIKMHLLSYNKVYLLFNLLLSSGAVHGRGFISPRIIGGNPVTAGNIRYPWFATVGDGCGGQLISPEFILTAAHCIDTSCREENGEEICEWKENVVIQVGVLCENDQNNNCGQVS